MGCMGIIPVRGVEKGVVRRGRRRQLVVGWWLVLMMQLQLVSRQRWTMTMIGI